MIRIRPSRRQLRCENERLVSSFFGDVASIGMIKFTQVLQLWQPFYATIATAAATLTGLLFVSLSLNRHRLDDPGRMAARRTFSNLVDVLVLSLIFLIPHERQTDLGFALLVYGFVRSLTTVVEAIKLHKRGVWVTFSKSFARHIGLQLVLSLGILIFGGAIYRQIASAMFWPVAIVVGLLGSASWNAWELLFKE